MVSSPPPVRFKLLLFGIFVVLVAVVTFMVLYMLKPFESTRHPPPVPEKEAPAEKQPQPPAPAKSAPTAAAEKKAAETAKPAIEDQRPDAPDPQPATTKDAKPTVGAPVIEQKSGKWQITFKVDDELKCKHFTLRDPPRLAVDFLEATYSGQERLLESPAPFISKIRVGEKPEYTRYVIDFSGDKVPKYQVDNQKEAVVVSFEN